MGFCGVTNSSFKFNHMTRSEFIPVAAPAVKVKSVGVLVMVNNCIPVIAESCRAFVKNGKKQFWMLYNNRSILATQTPTGYAAKF